MNGVSLKQEPTAYKNLIRILSAIALVCAGVNFIGSFMGFRFEDSRQSPVYYFRFLGMLPLVVDIIEFMPAVLLAVYAFFFHSSGKGGALIPLAFGAMWLTVFSPFKYIGILSWEYVLPDVDVFSIVILFVAFVLALMGEATGRKKVLLLIAVALGMLVLVKVLVVEVRDGLVRYPLFAFIWAAAYAGDLLIYASAFFVALGRKPKK